MASVQWLHSATGQLVLDQLLAGCPLVGTVMITNVSADACQMIAGGCVSAGWWMNAGCCCCLLLVTAAVDCCCWLLLLIVVRWLVAAGILLAGWLLVAAGCWMIGACWLTADCGWDVFAGEKVCEYFQKFDDLQLTQFCRRKSLWIFPGYWWFVAKTILQAK